MQKPQVCHVVIGLPIMSVILTFLLRTARETRVQVHGLKQTEHIMATTTFSPVHIGGATEARQGRSLLSRIFSHMVKARESEAKRRMAATFATYSDESLNDMGLTREEIARWHSGATD